MPPKHKLVARSHSKLDPCELVPVIIPHSPFLEKQSTTRRPSRIKHSPLVMDVQGSFQASFDMSRLPPELILMLFEACSTIESLLSLANLSQKTRSVWQEYPHKIELQERIARRQFEPFDELVHLATFYQVGVITLQPVPPMSQALLREVVRVGNTINDWLDLYPRLRWRTVGDAASRRVLTRHESFKFRRAMYRFYLYDEAFHDPDYLTRVRNMPIAGTDDPRITYIGQFSEDEIIELAEIHELIFNTVRDKICPSDSDIQRRFEQMFPGQGQLYFGTFGANGRHRNQPGFRAMTNAYKDLSRESWGSYDEQYAAAADIMKLNPANILTLRDDLQNRAERLDFMATLPPVFYNCPSSFRDALCARMAEMGMMLGCIYDYQGTGGILDW